VTALAAVALAIALLWLVAAVAADRLGAALPHLTDFAADAPPEPRASVIIPARDEEECLGACLASLRGQPGVREVLVVDDRSRDGTRRVAEEAARLDPRVRVLAAEEPPPGWTGKNHALSVGAAAAAGEYLLFLDADATLGPGAVAAALAAARARGADLLGALPAVECASFAESLVAPTMALLILVAFDPRRANDPADPTAMAPGSFLLFRREAYDALGGHATVRDDPVEDLRLAREVKRRGMRLFLVAGRGLVATRRPLSFRRLWDGWYRVLWRGLGERAWLGLIGAASVAAFFLFAPTAGFVAIATRSIASPAGALALGAALAQAAFTIALRRALWRRYGVDPAQAWLQPLGALFVVALLVAAATQGALGRHRARWSGREYR